MGLKVIGDRIVIRRTKLDERTEAGIIVPEKVRGIANHGTVVFVGTGRVLWNGDTVPPSLKAGDRVIFEEPRKAAEIFEHEGEKLILLREDQILAVEE